MDFKLNKNNLNFRVYTTPVVPETGNENDVAVITSVPMKNWVISPDAPQGAPRNDGDVWFRYSVTGNTFNATKSGSLMIAIISAKQYVGGAWCDVGALFFQNGAWTQFVKTILLFDGGVENLSLLGTNGFVSKTADIYRFEKTNEHILLMSSSSTPVVVSHEVPIDVTNQRKLLATVSTPATDQEKLLSFSVGISKDGVNKFKFTSPQTGSESTLEIDLDDVVGSVYITFEAPNIALYVYKIWLE